MSTSKFVVSHMDKQIGPFDEQELKAKWSKGEILPIDYIYDESVQDWILLSDKFPWAKADEVAPPPPLRVDSLIVRRMNSVSPATAPTAPVTSSQATPTRVDAGPEPAVSAVSAPDTKPTPNTSSSQLPIPSVTPGIRFEPLVPQGSNRKIVPPVAKVKLVDGIGEIDLSPLNPGRVELSLQDATAMLRLQEPHKINVRPAEPVEIVWSVSNQQVVGQDLEVSMKALDEHGNVCLHYSDQFVVQVRGPSPRDITVVTKDGQAHVKVSNTKAEMWTVAIHYGGPKSLRLPESRSVEWLAGTAARLVLDGPHEYIAGIPLKVKVKAVDTFGNVARNFQGTVTVDVKAS